MARVDHKPAVLLAHLRIAHARAAQARVHDELAGEDVYKRQTPSIRQEAHHENPERSQEHAAAHRQHRLALSLIHISTLPITSSRLIARENTSHPTRHTLQAQGRTWQTPRRTW